MAATGRKSELFRGWQRLDMQADDAERLLVSGLFDDAVQAAEALLNRALYVPSSDSVQTRASFVLLQALYEQSQ